LIPISVDEKLVLILACLDSVVLLSPAYLFWLIPSMQTKSLVDSLNADENLVLIIACLDYIDPPSPAYLVCLIPFLMNNALILIPLHQLIRLF